MKHLFPFIFLLAAGFSGLAQYNPAITSGELLQHISYLASDSLEGRLPGTKGDKLAAAYIRNHFQEAGLELLYDDGYQSFDLISDIKPSPECNFQLNNIPLQINTMYAPALYSGNGTLASKVIFCGYGFAIQEDSLKWNDYQEIRPQGKWVMLLLGDPEIDAVRSAFIPYSKDRTKVLTAIDNGAAGVLLVVPPSMEATDQLPRQYFDRSGASASIPVVYITREAANRILQGKGTIAELNEKLDRNRRPLSFETNTEITVTVQLDKTFSHTANVVALLPGSDPGLSDEYLLVGAHFDHLGFGGPGSGSRMPDTVAVHNGADDNASGVAAVIELAQYFAAHTARHPRSILFAAFTAEESGLVGSKYMAKNLPVEKDKLMAMFNFDMIGRYNKEKGKISIGGTGTSLEADSLIDHALEGYTFGVAKSTDGYGPSDHASFYALDVPVFFISTGAHQDYHTPFDDVAAIDAIAAEAIARFSARLLQEVTTMEKPLSFQKTRSATGDSRSSMRLKVTLGIMPDMVSQNNDGLGVDGVRPGGPADKGGIVTGDRIVAINGERVTNIYSYMHRLGTLKPGETAVVEIVRNGKNEILLIQL